MKLFNKKSLDSRTTQKKSDNGGNNFKYGKSNLEKDKREGYKVYQKDEENKETKLVGNLGFHYNFYNGENHFPKECMHRNKMRRRERKNMMLIM